MSAACVMPPVFQSGLCSNVWCKRLHNLMRAGALLHRRQLDRLDLLNRDRIDQLLTHATKECNRSLNRLHARDCSQGQPRGDHQFPSARSVPALSFEDCSLDHGQSVPPLLREGGGRLQRPMASLQLR